MLKPDVFCHQTERGSDIHDELIARANAVSRRGFLWNTAFTLGALLAAPATIGAQQCRLTESEILGPFYRFDAPFRTRLAGPDEPGDRLMVSGTVYSSDCRTPLRGTLIEVW